MGDRVRSSRPDDGKSCERGCYAPPMRGAGSHQPNVRLAARWGAAALVLAVSLLAACGGSSPSTSSIPSAGAAAITPGGSAGSAESGTSGAGAGGGGAGIDQVDGSGCVAEVKEGLLFVNKKKQKNFLFFGIRGCPRTPMSEVFWFFFSKKNYFLFRNTHNAARTRFGIVVGRRSRVS